MIKRERYLAQIRPFIGKDIIKVLTGVRRCGKSIMLTLIQDELKNNDVQDSQIISMNFENMQYASLRTHVELREEVLRLSTGIQGKAYLFFDEIQEVESWEKCVNSLRIELDCDIYITGSNAKLLSGELSTNIAGRYVSFVIYPFSFSEFCELYKAIVPKATKRECFNQYVTFGGMPYLSNLLYAEEPSKTYMRDIFNSVVLKDIIKRNSVRDVDMLERIIAYVFDNVGNIFSASSVAKYIKSEGRKIAPETVLNYIAYCEEAFLVYKAKRQDVRGKKTLAVNEKYYVVDHGLREAVYGGNQRDIQSVLENIVYMELIRRGYTVTVGELQEKEIDFVCSKGNDKLYYQVCYMLADANTIAREFGALQQVRDNYPKYVLSLDDFNMSRDGIIHQNIIDFLLGDDQSRLFPEIPDEDLEKITVGPSFTRECIKPEISTMYPHIGLR